MELLIYLILFLLVLIVSSTTNKLLPFLPLPLVQILLGIVIGLFLPNTDFHLNTELFLALVIGPLLFREAEEADVTAILKHSGKANHCLSHISSDFYLDPEFGWLGPSSLVQPSLGSLLGCWCSPWSYGLGGLCLSFGAF